MIAQGRGGSIINASSGAGRRGVPNLSHYCASKAGIIMLTQSLAVELAATRSASIAMCRAISRLRSGKESPTALPP